MSDRSVSMKCRCMQATEAIQRAVTALCNSAPAAKGGNSKPFKKKSILAGQTWCYGWRTKLFETRVYSFCYQELHNREPTSTAGGPKIALLLLLRYDHRATAPISNNLKHDLRKSGICQKSACGNSRSSEAKDQETMPPLTKNENKNVRHRTCRK